MQDRPYSHELTEAVAQFLSDEVVPVISDARLRFRVLIAANLMTVLTRELTAGDAPLRAEWQQLSTLLGYKADEPPHHLDDLRRGVEALNRELAARVRTGEADEGAWRRAVLAHVETAVIERLRIANPKFLKRTTA